MAKHIGCAADDNWWTLWPKILNDELGAFARLGITPQIIHKGSGVLILEADWPIQGQSVLFRLRIGYSPLHPFFPPAVAAPDENFERHQNPFTRDLCLLTQETGQWNSNQLVADFIQERLDQLLRVLAARKEGRWDDAAQLEEQAADPLMPYFAGAAELDSVVLFDGQMTLPPGGHGIMEIVCTNHASRRNPIAFEGVLRQLNTSTGTMHGRFLIPNERTDVQSVTGRWVKFTPPPIADAGELHRLAEEELARQAVMQPGSVQKVNEKAKGVLSITGIVFPEEAEYGPEKNGAGWLFLATRRRIGNGRIGPTNTTLILGERAGREDIFSRLPIAISLRKKKALVVGCGAIGSFAGLELARAGLGEIAFLDHETVQPGNSLRWPLGRSVWGKTKAPALADFIAENYPWTTVRVFDGRIGTAITDPARVPRKLEGNVLKGLFDTLRNTDVVIDCSASFEVQHAVSHYCRRFNVPYVVGYATLGVAGGVVARFLPQSLSCLVCLHEHWNDGQHIPKPRVDDAGMVILVGCNAPTFTGSGFDLQEVSLEIVRSAIGILSEGKYDPGNWQVAILTLKKEGGERILPHWKEYNCPPHPRCCGAR